jgi:hypothetical protein
MTRDQSGAIDVTPPGDYKNFDGVSGVKPEEALPARESKV